MKDIAKENSQSIKPAGTWVRFWASLIDGWIVSIPIYLILFLVFILKPSFANLRIESIIIHIAGLFYSVYLTVKKGATWGKDAYGLKVVEYKTNEFISYKKAVTRDLVKNGFFFIPIISGLFSIIDGFTIIFSPEKRGIHDKIAGTQVIKVKNSWPLSRQFLILVPLVIISFALILSYSRITMKNTNTSNSQRSQTVKIIAPLLNLIPASKQFAEANNVKRRSDINTILNEVNIYSSDNNGTIPNVITISEKEISKSQADLCDFFVPKYWIAFPTDPKVNKGLPIKDCKISYSTGYTIFKDSSTNKITVRAPHAELGEKIEVTR